jgi:DNA (cytosine-5)-methyltransferase 1
MKSNIQTYISLFSGAGIGCYGFKQEGFHCIATVELLEKRLNFQRFNDKCIYESGYISGDLCEDEIKSRIFSEFDFWEKKYSIKDLDVLIATPPCQGMSLANHKKKDELKRNSLVVESIKITQELNPKYFVFENVRNFLTTICTDIDNQEKSIKDAIENNLAAGYNILYQVLNFKDYGNPSSRTRTLVVGTRKDLLEVTPLNILPDLQKEKTLKEVIGHLKPLEWGEIDEKDIYHSFKTYSPNMLEWIKDLKEGESAFDNTDASKLPHRKIKGLVVYNVRKNGDKYKRQYWDRVAPCIHTRNDIMSSQNTLHPIDSRVFSVREVALMMSIPFEFCFSDIPFDKLNTLSVEEKRVFLRKAEMNIRHSIGEGVPTIIFKQIAQKIKVLSKKPVLSEQEVNKLIDKHKLASKENLIKFLTNYGKNFSYPNLAKIAELSNALRLENSAYYTRQDICYTVVKELPDMKSSKILRILEPSIGVGNFLPLLFEKYKTIPTVIIDALDIDSNSIEILKLLLNSIKIPDNFQINFTVGDFLLYPFEYRYDVIVGNPPYKKITNQKTLLGKYKENAHNTDTNNIFSFFIEKSLRIADYISFIVPKSLINAPEFDKTRDLLEKYTVKNITDYGEAGFKGVKIETLSFFVETQKKSSGENVIKIESYFLKKICYQKQNYIFSKDFPYWLIYRDSFFDEVAKKLKFNIFNAYRDRQISKKHTKEQGKFRVLKSRNIASNKIVDIENYDCYVDDLETFGVSKFINVTDAVLLPNLTYSPRACFLPQNCIADGSVAILTLRNGSRKITPTDLEYYSTKEFEKFYAIARNYGTRSLNIDNNSVFFFGIIG